MNPLRTLPTCALALLSLLALLPPPAAADPVADVRALLPEAETFLDQDLGAGLGITTAASASVTLLRYPDRCTVTVETWVQATGAGFSYGYRHGREEPSPYGHEGETAAIPVGTVFRSDFRNVFSVGRGISVEAAALIENRQLGLDNAQAHASAVC